LIPRTATDHDVLNGHWTEYWRRGRHIYTAPVGNDATYIAFFSINARGQGHRRVVSERDVQTATLMPLEVERWRSLFPVLEEQLSRITETPLWTRFVEVHLPRWSGNRVVVIGDAAHAMAPALGSGGTTAMSDAISLANAVCRGSIGEALTSWERAHRGFVDRVQASSRRWGYFFHLPSVAQRTVLFHGVKNSPHVHRLRFDYLHHRPELLGERRRDADREPGGPLS
jgi:2-polyprenyl-6-methoxyphenol hydroxylase-like FAD-dependent oxidoreductase